MDEIKASLVIESRLMKVIEIIVSPSQSFCDYDNVVATKACASHVMSCHSHVTMTNGYICHSHMTVKMNCYTILLFLGWNNYY